MSSLIDTSENGLTVPIPLKATCENPMSFQPLPPSLDRGDATSNALTPREPNTYIAPMPVPDAAPRIGSMPCTKPNSAGREASPPSSRVRCSDIWNTLYGLRESRMSLLTNPTRPLSADGDGTAFSDASV